MYNKAQVHHRLRWTRQLINRPDIAIVGGYHFGNLGDMALGHAVVQLLNANPETGVFRNGLQTIYNLEKWGKPSAIIVGGGAVVDNFTLDRVFAHVANDAARVCFLGVDFLDRDLSAENLMRLADCSGFVVRNSEDCDWAISNGITQAEFIPDLVFTLTDLSEPLKSDNGTGAGFNLVPQLDGNDVCQNSTVPLVRAYIEHFEVLISSYLDSGLEVSHIPFTPADGEVARRLFGHMPINFRSYSPNVPRVLELVKQLKYFLPSRYHGLIFGMISKTKTIPFLYADKCYRLLEDFFPEMTAAGIRDFEGQRGRLKTSPIIELDVSDLVPVVHRTKSASSLAINNLVKSIT